MVLFTNVLDFKYIDVHHTVPHKIDKIPVTAWYTSGCKPVPINRLCYWGT